MLFTMCSHIDVKNGKICLTDEKLLAVLHAHTRATDIRYLAVSPQFQAFNDLIWIYIGNTVL